MPSIGKTFFDQIQLKSRNKSFLVAYIRIDDNQIDPTHLHETGTKSFLLAQTVHTSIDIHAS